MKNMILIIEEVCEILNGRKYALLHCEFGIIIMHTQRSQIERVRKVKKPKTWLCL